ncbi:MAG: hypothetical protein E7Z80_06215 [Methanobrevibacter thaueri]|nr:hypothetical protein [Methanobrevibacter thaueri]
MKNKEFAIKTKTISETFNDKRPIKCIVAKDMLELDENIHQGGDIFKTENGDLIDLEFQLQDFNEEELVKYVEFAEALYEKTNKHISVYLICPKNIDVLVKECEIKSEADFTIRLSCIAEDPCQIILNNIKHKLNRGEIIDCYDLETLEKLPLVCNKKDRNYFRLEYLKIINRIHY